MESLYGNVTNALEEALLESSVDSSCHNAMRELIVRMKVDKSDVAWQNNQPELRPSPGQIAAMYLSVAGNVACMDRKHGWRHNDTSQAGVLRAAYQAFVRAALQVIHGTVLEQCSCQQSYHHGLCHNMSAHLFDVAHGRNLNRRKVSSALEDVPWWSSDWACVAASAIRSALVVVGRHPHSEASGMQCSKSSLQYSNSASGGSAGIGTNGTFCSANASAQEFLPTTESSAAFFPLDCPQQMEDQVTNHRSHLNMCTHLRTILAEATLSGRLQRELEATATGNVDKATKLEAASPGMPSTDDPATVVPLSGVKDTRADGELLIPPMVASSICAKSSAAPLEEPVTLRTYAEAHGRAEHEPTLAEAQSSADSNVDAPIVPGFDSLPSVAHVSENSRDHMELDRNCDVPAALVSTESLATEVRRPLDPDEGQHVLARQILRQDVQASTSRRLRPWEDDAGHRADVLIRHLDEVGREQGAAAVERCLYADGLLPLRPEHPSRNGGIKRGAERLANQEACAAPAQSNGSRAAKPVASSLLSMARPINSSRLEDVQKQPKPPGSGTPSRLLQQSSLERPVAQNTRISTRQAESGARQPGVTPAAKGAPQASNKLPAVPLARGSQKASAASAAEIYSQSFRKVSSDAADKSRLYRSSQSLPVIEVKRRNPPQIPACKWRPPC